jgi:hypothetical protein
MIKITALTAAASLALIALTGCSTASDTAAPESTMAASSSPEASASSSESAAAPKVTTAPKAPVVEEGIATADETERMLTYLIEEEKLAKDVYQAMLDLWGSKVFGNILKSEESHQSQVLSVMATRDIADPRSSEPGVFKNAELQKLYDELIAKGSKSAVDAYEVGVAIEVLDIDDLTKMLATAKDADVIAMMENLRRGSENHLRAFNNQLNK